MRATDISPPDLPMTPIAAGIRRSLATSATLALVVNSMGVLAAPVGGKVTGGEGKIMRPDANTTVIRQTSRNLVVDWQGFNVAADEMVLFKQPGSQAGALNRIFDQNPSHIFGNIEANGRVFLMNPNGILFGKTAQVNVGALVASGLDVSKDDFMRGKLKFKGVDGTSGSVVNQGVLQAATGGSVDLVGKAVANEGKIIATAGQVNLAAGEQATLDFEGDGLMRFSVDEAVVTNAESLDAAVSNSGEINADGGHVVLTGKAAKDVFNKVVNNEGIVKAGRVDNRGGVVRLVGLGGGSSVLNTGTVDVSATAVDADSQPTGDGGEIVVTAHSIVNTGELKADATSGNGGTIVLESSATDSDEPATTELSGNAIVTAKSKTGEGGTVHLLGDQVGLFQQTLVDVSGGGGGGTVLVGGDVQGKNPKVKNAEITVVAPDAKVQAKGIDAGAGGTVIVYADDHTEIYGELSVRGGEDGGGGGFIETSGKDSFVMQGKIDIAAGKGGKGGHWLIDPRSVNIDDGATATTADITDMVAMVTGFTTYQPNVSGTAGVISGSDLRTALGTGDVTIITADGDDLTVNAAALEGDITFSSGFDFNGIGTGRTLTLRAADDIIISGAIMDSDTMTAVDSLNLVMVANSDGTDIMPMADLMATPAYNPDPGSGRGDIQINGAINLNSGNLVLSVDGGQVTQMAAIEAAGLVLLGTQSTGLGTPSYTLTNSGNDIDTLAGNVAGSVNFLDADDFEIGTVGYSEVSGANFDSSMNVNIAGLTATSSITLSTTGTVTQSGVITASSLLLLGTGGIYTLNTQDNVIATLAGDTGTVSFRGDSTGFTVGAMGSTDGLTTRTGAIDLQSANGEITLAEDLTVTGTGNTAALDINAGTAGVIIADNADIILSTGGGDITVTAGGGVEGTEGGGDEALRLASGGGAVTLPAVNTGETTVDTGLAAFTISHNGVSMITVGMVDAGVFENREITATGDFALGAIDISGNLIINSGGANTITQTGIITANGLSLLGTGGIYTLNTQNNAITTLAGNTGTVSFQDNTGFAIGTVEGTAGLTATGNVVLSSTGTVTQSGIITANGLSLLGTGGIYTLNTQNNAITTLAGNTGTVSFRDDNGFAIGTVEGTAGLAATTSAELTVTGTLSQSQAITTPTLTLLGSGTYNLGSANNVVTTLDVSTGTLGGDLSFRDDDGFAITAVNAGTNDVILSSTGTVTQSGIITANGLSLLGTGGIYTLNTQNNAITTLAGNTGTVSFRDDNGFAIGTVEGTAGLAATTSAELTVTGTLSQSQAITTPTLTLLGSGTYNLGSANNVVTTLDVSTGTLGGDLSFRDDDGFAITAVNAGTNDVILSSTGTVTQSGIITANGLSLLGTGGIYTLNTQNNAITTLAGNTGTVSFRDDNGFAIGTVEGTAGLAATTSAELTVTGTLSQSQAITTPTLTLLGSGTYNLGSANNVVTTLDVSTGTLGGDLSFRDDDGFAITAVNAGTNDVILSSTGTVTQSGIITANGLSLLGTGGIYTLNTQNNAITTLAGNTGTVSFRDDNGFAIGTVEGTAGLTATGNVVLSSTGTVTQSGIITANGLSLLGTGGIYTLNTQNNAITTLAGNTGTVSFRDDTGFAIGTVEGTAGLAATTSAELTVTGTLSQSQAITTPTLTLLGSGTYNLGSANNVVTTLDVSTGTLGGDLSFRDDDGFAITAVNAGTNDVILSSTGTVTQSGIITANGLSLLGTGGIYTLNTQNNAITTLAGNTGTVSFRDDNGFAIGTVEGTAGLAATVSAELTVASTGTLSQSQAITTPTLTLLGRGTYNLAGANNDVDTLDVDDEIAMSLGGDLSFRDDDGFAITAVNAGTNDVILSSTGTVTQSGIITANGLSLLGTGGIYTLNTQNNAITTLAGNTGTVSFRDDNGFAIGTVEGTAGLAATVSAELTVASTGTLSQSQAITTPTLTLLGRGTYNLAGANNDVDTLDVDDEIAMSLGGDLSFRDDDGFAITAVNAGTNDVILSSTGTVTQSGIITANGLSLLGTGGIYTLNTQNNAITTLAGNTGTVSFRDDNGFAIGTVEGTAGLAATTSAELTVTGTLSQSQAITTPTLTLLGSGTYNLGSANNVVTTLDVSTGTLGGDLSFRDDDGFAITAVNAGTNDVILSSTGTVTQSGIITANGLSLLGTGGIYTLNTQNNAITTLAGNTGTVSFRDDNGFAIGTVEGTAGLTATGNVVLSSTGTVTQSGIITANGLSLLGTGGIYTLNTQNNAITTLAGNTGTVSFRDDNGFAIGTVEGTAGLAATTSAELTVTGTLSQSQAITTPTLTLLGSGTYNLGSANNVVTTLDVSTGTLGGDLSFRDDDGFAITAVNAGTNDVILSSTGTVTQSGIITANGLSLLGTGGIYTLNTQNNAITTLAGNTGTVSFRDDTGFAIGTVEGTAGLAATVSAELTVASTGTLSQSQAITTPTLTLLGSGTYNLGSANNVVTTLDVSTGTLGGDLSFRDDDGFAITAVNAGTNDVILSSTGTVTQSGIITANGLSLLGTGGIYTLNTQNNAITTLAGNTGTVSFRDDNGFAIGTVEGTAGLTATGNVVLSSTGTVTQSGIITANGLSLLGTGGIYTLNTQNNAITTLAGNTGTVSFRDDTGFAIGTVEGTAGLAATTSAELTVTGTLSQSQAITTPTLTLLGSGTYNLGSANNVVTTLDVSTGTLGGDLSFRDDDGFAITAVNAGTNDVILSSTGTVTQSGIITANGLSLLGTGGIYTLNTQNNAITTLAGNTGTVSFRDDTGFAIGTVEGTAGLAATVSAELTVASTGTLSQSQAITTPTLTLLGRGTYNLAGANNDVDTLDVDDEIAMSLGGDLSFRDDDGFAITAVNAGTNDVILSSTGTVTQSGIITANGLSLLGTGGIYTLNTQNNAITTLAGNTGTVSFRDDNGFAIGTVEGTAGLAATVSAELTVASTGTLSQSQAITTPTLTLLGSGTYNLGSANNVVTTLDVSTGTLGGDLSFRDDDGFAITAVNAGTNDVILSSTGTVTQSGIITANGLSLLGTGGIYTLNTQNNAITTLAGNTGTVSFRDDNGFAIGTVEGTAGLTATGNVVLSSTGTVTQSGIITANGLSLLGTGGIYTLNTQNNAITTLAGNTGTVSFRDDNGFAIGTVEGTAGLTATGNVVLSSTGTVTQSGIITANGLSLLGTGGIYTLNTQNNAITTLAGNTGTVSFQDDTGFAIGTVEGTAGLTATGNVVLSSTGTVTQSGIITANGLSLLGTGGIYTLNTQNNAITTLAGNTGTVSFRDDNGFAIGTVEGTAGLTATGNVVLSSTGTVTQSGIITANGLSLLGTGGIYTLNTQNNAITTLAGNTGTVSFRDDNGFAIGTVEGTAGLTATGNVVLSSTGTVTQSGIITANGLSLLGTGGIYTLNTQNNAITTLAGNTGTVSFQDDTGFAIGTVEGTAGLAATVSAELTVASTGTLSQSQAITTPTLTLLGRGTYNLAGANNDVDTLDVDDEIAMSLGGDLSFRDDDGFAITAVNAGTNDVILSSTGTVTQSGIITANGLSLLGTGGIYTLNTQNNAITTLAGNTGTVSFRDDTGFAIGTVEGTAGLAATVSAELTVASTGTLSQSQAITTPTLTLLGRGTYNLAGANNDVDTLDVDDEIAMSLGGDLSFRDDDGFAITAVNAGTNDVILSSTGTVTQSGIITANGLSLLGTGGIYTLNTQNNAITTLAGNTGTVSFRDDTGFAIGTVEGTAGLAATVSAELTVASTGTLSQSQAITTPTLTLLGRGTYNLAGANNDVDTLDVDDEITMSLGGELSFLDVDGFAVTAVNAGTHNVLLEADSGMITLTGDITQSAGSSSITFDGDIDIDSGSGILTLTSDTINFNGMVTGDDALSILPATDGREIVIGASSGNIDSLIIDNTRFANFQGALFIGGAVLPDFIPLFTTPDLITIPDFNAIPADTIDVKAVKVTVTEHLTTMGPIVLLAGDIELASNTPDPGRGNAGIAITAGGQGAPPGHNLLLLAIGGSPTSPLLQNPPPINPPSAGDGRIIISTRQTLEAGYIGMVATDDVDRSENLVLALGGGGVELARGLAGGVAQFDPTSRITPVGSESMGFDTLLEFLRLSGFTVNVTAVQAVNPATELVGTTNVGFIDTGLFEQELTVFSQVGTGIALALSQCEELEGCSPNVTEEELNVLIAELEERLAALEQKVLELRASGELGELPELEELIDGYRAELDNFLAYRDELKEFLSVEVEEEIDLDEDIFGDEFVEDVIKQLAKALEHIKERLQWLESLKGDPEARARLSEATGIELTQEALDAIIKATEAQSELIEKRINLLLQGAGLQQHSPSYFTAESGRPSQAIDYAPYRLPMFSNGVWWF